MMEVREVHELQLVQAGDLRLLEVEVQGLQLDEIRDGRLNRFDGVEGSFA